MRWPYHVDGYRALVITIVAQALVDAQAVQAGRRRRFAGVPLRAVDDIQEFFAGPFELYADFLDWDAESVRAALRRQGLLGDGEDGQT